MFVVEFFGPTSVGKTTLCRHIVAIMKKGDIKVLALSDLLPFGIGRKINPSFVNFFVELFLIFKTNTIIDRNFWLSLANVWFCKRDFKLALSRSVLRKIGLYNWAKLQPNSRDMLFLFDEGMVQIVQNSVLRNGGFKPIIPFDVMANNVAFGVHVTADIKVLLDRSVRRPNVSRRLRFLNEKELGLVFETSMLEFDRHVDILERLKPGCICRMGPYDPPDELVETIITKIRGLV